MMKQLAEFKSMQRWQGIMVWVVSFLFGAIYVGGSFLDKGANVPAGIKYIFLVGWLLLLFAAFCSYIRYVCYEDRFELRTWFGIKPPLVLVFGKRINRYIAFPLTLIRSTIKYSNIHSLHYEEGRTVRQVYPIPVVYVVLKNNRQFRLPFPTERENALQFIRLVSRFVPKTSLGRGNGTVDT